MQIFLCISWKWRAFATPFHDPISKDRIKCMFTLVWKYINLSDALRVKCYTNITHTTICTSAFKIWLSDVYTFIVLICLLFDLAAHPFRKFPFSSVYRRVRERSSGSIGSERNRLEKQNREYRSFFLTDRFLKTLNSCASVVEQTTGCNWGGFCFYFNRITKHFHLLPFFFPGLPLFIDSLLWCSCGILLLNSLVFA